MTIPTKSNPDSKEAKESLTKKDVEVGMPTASHVADNSENADHEYNLLLIQISQTLRRRRLLTSLCALLLILWLLTAAVLGAILLRKYIQKKDIFYGACSADYVDETKQRMKLQQQVEIDEANEYEKIEVPQLGVNHPGSFLHDFRQNLTAIVDATNNRCFVKPLDRSQIAPPSSFIDFVRKAEAGYYALDTPVIREDFEVRLPSISGAELNRLGSFLIVGLCGRPNFETFMLDKRSEKIGERSRRDAKNCETLHFVFYNPNGAVIQENINGCFK